MEKFRNTLTSVWGMLGINTGVFAAVQFTETLSVIEQLLKILLLAVTITTTILIAVKKLRKEK